MPVTMPMKERVVGCCGRVNTSNTLPCSMTRPDSSTATLWQISLMTCISWVMRTTVSPSLRLISAISRSTSRVVSGSSALVASSHSSTFGSVASARAMPTRCFCPPDSSAG